MKENRKSSIANDLSKVKLIKNESKNDKSSGDDATSLEEEVPSLSFITLFRFSSPMNKLYIFLAIIFSITCGCMTPVNILLFSSFLQSMVNYGKSNAENHPEPDVFLGQVRDLAIYSSLVGAIIVILSYAATVLMNISACNQATGQRIGIILQGVGSVGLALFLAMWCEWRVGMVAFAFLPLVIIVIWQQGKATDNESEGYAKALENSTKIAVEALSNIRTVACLGLESSVHREYAQCLSPARKSAILAAHWRGLLSGLSRSMFNFVNAAALTYGGHLIVSEGVAYQDILITTQSLQMASSQAQNAFAYAPNFQKGMNAAARIVNLLNEKPKMVEPEKSLDNFVSVLRPFLKVANGDAKFEGVKFKYPSRPTVKVLRGFNLQILHGQTVVLVGHSGCGKSTVIQLLLRYYDPDYGAITLSERSLRDLRVSEVRANFGLVSQEPTLFERSIRENIEYGDTSRIVTDQEVVKAAKLGNIHDFIISLPQGYKTDIGSKGIQLSGGQKQRVAIARALIRNPKILLLDEATSALDGENEKAVLAASVVGRTCLLVTHGARPLGKDALVHALEAGRVLEHGTHEELMLQRGLYYSLHVGQ